MCFGIPRIHTKSFLVFFLVFVSVSFYGTYRRLMTKAKRFPLFHFIHHSPSRFFPIKKLPVFECWYVFWLIHFRLQKMNPKIMWLWFFIVTFNCIAGQPIPYAWSSGVILPSRSFVSSDSAELLLNGPQRTRSLPHSPLVAGVESNKFHSTGNFQHCLIFPFSTLCSSKLIVVFFRIQSNDSLRR